MRLVLTLLALGFPLAAHCQPAAPARPPNVLLIVVDDLNTALGCYGNRVVQTPHIDRLAARGTRFARAYCQYPLCNPSRVSFLSGRRPETSGVYALNISARRALPEAVMLPQFFRQQGYFTAGAGKIFHNPPGSDPASWDSYEDGPGDDPEEKAAIRARYGGGDGRPSWTVLESDGSRTRDGLNARTILRLLGEKAESGQSFFLAAGFHKPHLPWTAPKRFFDLYPEKGIPIPADPPLRDVPTIALQTELTGFAQPESRAAAIRAYYACVSFIDAQIGLLLDELDRRSLWKTTVVALISDHGFHLGDHGGLWAKLSAFDAATQVPFLIAGAGVPEGRVVSAPVELLDVYPTLAELCSLPAPRGLEGQSLVALLRSTDVAATRRPATSLVYHFDPKRGIDIPGRTVISAQWRYTEWAGGNEGRELYARADDPGEYHNRAADPSYREAVREGEALLRAAPPLKSGNAERPRALMPKKAKSK